MDWEKKTAVRDALVGAASDPFNDLLTPGQSLLRSIQDAEGVRKDRYGNTVGAKMKTAREKLPALHPKHAVRSDMTIFRTAAAPEVHALLADTRPAKVRWCWRAGDPLGENRNVWERIEPGFPMRSRTPCSICPSRQPGGQHAEAQKLKGFAIGHVHCVTCNYGSTCRLFPLNPPSP